MIRTLRNLDRLYFGHGHNSCLHALSALLAGTMPGGFLDRYHHGKFDIELVAFGLHR